MEKGGAVEIYEIAHRIYSLGRDKKAGWRRYVLKDQAGQAVARGRYGECIQAISALRLAAASNC